jgi:hypothetical protein
MMGGLITATITALLAGFAGPAIRKTNSTGWSRPVNVRFGQKVCHVNEWWSGHREIAQSCRQIFISFAALDRTEVEAIVDYLEANNLTCWISTRHVPVGTNFSDAIVAALEQASALLLVFSKNADKSEGVKKEVALAGQYRLPVLPVRIDDVQPTKGFKYELATRQYIDLFADREQNMANVIDALRKHLQNSNKPRGSQPRMLQ